MSNAQELVPIEKRYEDVKLSAEYVESRVKYPKFVFETILDYVEKSLGTFPKYPLAVDIGCGPGLMSTVFLAPYFDKVLGVDISESQIEQATLNNKHSNIEYSLSVAEKLPVEENSVTLIQVATALHWLNYEKFYRECDRVLVPGGVIAAFSYTVKDILIVNHPRSLAIQDVLMRISNKLASFDINPYYSERNEWAARRYTYPRLQIPYEDTKRVDGQYMEFPSTISGILRCLMTTAYIRLFVNNSEENQLWWKDCHQRLMEAYGTDDPEAPLTFKLEVFMLLGRKPTL